MKLVFLSFLVLLVSCNSNQPLSTPVKKELNVEAISNSTVLITNLQGTSGGSGTIVAAAPSISLILTNSHVCEVVKRGGKVSSNQTSLFVTHFGKSQIHDLCMIVVQGNLGPAAKISNKIPHFMDKVLVSGHPQLLPTILSPGHFSGKVIIPVMIGVAECTEEQEKDPTTGFFCFMLGGLPTIKNYESVVVSSLIQPGSSGSAVYNEEGEVSAVIFAGSGDIGYGFAVPLEYVITFLKFELPGMVPQRPDTTSILGKEEQENKTFEEKLKETCSKVTTQEQKDLCNRFQEAIKNKLL